MGQANDTVTAAALRYGELFPAVYRRLHRRDGKGAELSNVAQAVLSHLAESGPMTVGECARHFDRAQSVASDIISGLERRGLLARVRDEDDRRRTLVWLSDEGRELVVHLQDVLSHELLAAALDEMSEQERAALLEGTRALVRAADMLAARETHTGGPRP